MEDLDKRTPEMMKLAGNKADGWNYRQRRHEAWREIYDLYKNTVIINRLTQRQSVNVPMMKQHIGSLLKDIDDMPVIYLENLDNDKEKEVFLNEYWKWTAQNNNMELQDVVDKKQVLLFGRTFDQWQIEDGAIKQTIIDPQDILVSRYTDPSDLHSSRFLIHTHIYKPLRELKENEEYDQQAVKKLEDFYATDLGLHKIADNELMAIEKSQKLSDLGVTDVLQPHLGESMVEINLHFVYDKGEGDEEEELWVKTEADGQVILKREKLEDIMGVTKDHWFRTHFPYESWADDLERQDFWSDGKGDIVRTPNKIANSYWSQLVENRTLRNYGMHYYDGTNESFQPSTFNPVPWGWYPVPGKPSDVLSVVDIPDLTESLDELQYLGDLTERATGATATQQGTQTAREVTLGEVKLALGEAKERTKGISKFYTEAWYRRATLFLKLVEANASKLDAVKIWKKGVNTDAVYGKLVEAESWHTKSGYQAKVWNQDDKNTHDSDLLQKINAAVSLIPGNQKLIDIYQRKLLEFARVTPEEMMSVLEEERRKREVIANQGVQGGVVPNPVNPGMNPQPAQVAQLPPSMGGPGAPGQSPL